MSAPGADDLGARLLSAVAQFNRWANKRSELPLSTAQGRLLGLVESNKDARIGELAAADHCSQPTMTAQVKRLEEQGLVVRTPDEDDARASRISLTADGAEVIKQVRRLRSAAVEPVLSALSPQDREVLLRATELLGHIVDANP